MLRRMSSSRSRRDMWSDLECRGGIGIGSLSDFKRKRSGSGPPASEDWGLATSCAEGSASEYWERRLNNRVCLPRCPSGIRLGFHPDSRCNRRLDLIRKKRFAATSSILCVVLGALCAWLFGAVRNEFPSC